MGLIGSHLGPDHASALAVIYLVVAVVCTWFAHRCAKRVIAPVGLLAEALAAAILAALAIGAALVLFVTAAHTGK